VPWRDAHGYDAYLFQQSTLITTQAPLFLSVMTCHSLERTQRTLYTCLMLASPIALKNSLPELDLNPGRREY